MNLKMFTLVHNFASFSSQLLRTFGMARSMWQNEFFGSWLPENRGKERKGHIAEIPFKGAYLET